MSLITLFLNKTSLSKSFCSLRSSFQIARYEVIPGLRIFGAFEMTAHVK